MSIPREKATFKVSAPLPIRVGVSALFAFPLVHASIVVGVEMRSGALPLSLVFVAAGCLLLLLATLSAGASASVNAVEIRIGFFPIWITRIPRHQVRSVEIVTIDAYRDYNGWGIKGSAKTTRGRLYSAGGPTAIKISTVNGQTFLMAFPENSPMLSHLHAMTLPSE